MDDIKTKESIRITSRRGIYYVLDEKGKCLTHKSWLFFPITLLYDRLMKANVLPKKLEASFTDHQEYLRSLYKEYKGQNVLDIGAGTGEAVHYLDPDNNYAGIDVSTGLLRVAQKKLRRHGFEHAQLYHADACELPFANQSFHLALCNLSLNFFKDLDLFIPELQRVLKPGGHFYCSVPLPERNLSNHSIEGSLRSMTQLQAIFEKYNFRFEPFHKENGLIGYFQAVLL